MKRTSSYTLIEMVIVLVIMGLISVLVITRVVGTPRRMIVESALSGIRVAFAETAMSARTSGKIKGLILDPDSRMMVVTDVVDELDFKWMPESLRMPENSPELYKPEYQLSSSIEWENLPDTIDYDGVSGIRFLFFPDGQAAGDDVEFSIFGRRFYWSIDHVLGRAVIYELD